MSIKTLRTDERPDRIHTHYIEIQRKIQQLNSELHELKQEAAEHKIALIKYYAGAGLFEYLQLNEAAIRKIK